MANIPKDNDDTQKLTKREEQRVRELERLAESLQQANLLYGSALDGMEEGLSHAAKALDEFGLNKRMAAAEDEIAAKAEKIFNDDTHQFASAEDELHTDDAEEEALLAEDEDEPSDRAA